MADERPRRSGYEWDDAPDPSRPEIHEVPLGDGAEQSSAALPDLAAAHDRAGSHRSGPHRAGPSAADGRPLGAAEAAEPGPYGAPSFTYDPTAAAPEPRRLRGTLPAWAIVTLAAVQTVGLVLAAGLLAGGMRAIVSPPAADPSAAAPTPTSAPPASPTPSPSDVEKLPGTVTDRDGRELTDGTGGYEDPATIGEHTVAWTTWTQGTLSVTALEVDTDATLPGAQGADVLEDGFCLVVARFEVRYDGDGRLAPAEELWLTGESDRTYFPDVAQGTVDDPMKEIPPLATGRSARFRSVYIVPESEVDTFRLTVETLRGEPLYYATS